MKQIKSLMTQIVSLFQTTLEDPYPNIDGFDLSLWNESGGLIQWSEVALDPRRFRFCWVKCGEGTLRRGDPGAYDYAIYERQMKGAESIGLDTNGYWFWYYHLPWTLNPSAPGGYDFLLLDPTEQAAAFVASMGPFANKHPLLDIEDMYVGQFLVWTDTPSINRAIGFARKVNASLKKFFYEVWRLSGKKPDGYTGAWWLNKITKLLIDNGYGEEVLWMYDFDWYLADYNIADGLEVPPGINLDRVIAWQYASTTADPVRGIPHGDRVDLAKWTKSQADFDIRTGITTPLPPPVIGDGMTTLYNTAVSQTKRPVWLTLEGNTTLAANSVEMGITGIILPMMTMDYWDGNHMKMGPEATFKGRVNLFSQTYKLRVAGKCKLSAEYWLREGHTADEVNRQMASVRENQALGVIISQWHDGPWTWDDVLARRGKWLPLSYIELEMTGLNGKTPAQASDAWQALTLIHVLNPLKLLRDNGQIPNVPIVVYTGPWWLDIYNVDTLQQIVNRMSWLYLRLGDYTLASTATFATLKEIAAFRPAEDFRFGKWQDKKLPDGSIRRWTLPLGAEERVILHEYTGATDEGGQKCLQVLDGQGLPAKVNISLWHDTLEEQDNFFGAANPPVPPVDPTIALRARIAELELQVAGLQGLIDKIRGLVNA